MLTKNKLLIVILIVAAVLTVLLFSQRRFSENRTSEEFAGKTPESEKTEVYGEVVEDFSDFPIHPEAEVVNSYRKNENNKIGYEIILSSSSPVVEVMNWYIDQLPLYGWEISELPQNRESKMGQNILAVKGPMKLILTVEDEHLGGETEISAEVPLFIPE